ncbi:MAG TPA: hypothetical protein VIR31_07215 [Nitrososphaeraceae archaeon]
MLHQFILLSGFLASFVYSITTFKNVHKQGFHAEERTLSVIIGVTGIGFISILLAILHGSAGGALGLFVTIHEWLVIVGSLLVCHSINERHIKEKCYGVRI